jgi:hypothetical protein
VTDKIRRLKTKRDQETGRKRAALKAQIDSIRMAVVAAISEADSLRLPATATLLNNADSALIDAERAARREPIGGLPNDD